VIERHDANRVHAISAPAGMMNPKPKKETRPAGELALSFVIPVRNDAAGLQRCLASIRESLKGIHAEIIVGDNGSTDPSAKVAEAAGARVLHLPGRCVAEVRNLAAASAGGELLAFVDADNELAGGWVSAALGAMRDASTIAAGAHYRAPVRATWVQQLYDRLRGHQPGARAVDWLGSGNLVVRRSAFAAIGGFDTALETCEDVDLCQRLIARGGRIMGVDAMVSVHHGDPRTLGALFRGELWRGRDNLRVSLRVPLTLRALPGVAIPVLTLVGLGIAAVGMALLRWGSWPLVVAGFTSVVALSVPHAVLVTSRTPASERGLVPGARTLVFSVVYNVARALALVVRAGHRTRTAG
jgi:hypothetical protein